MKPEGDYQGTITTHGLVKSSSGTPALQIRAELEDGETITTVLWLSSKAMDRAKGILGGIGFTGRISQLDPRAPEPQSLKGKALKLRCKHETYKNALQEKWEIASGGSSLLPVAEFAAVDASWEGVAASPIGDDDVPF
jgi:hypothetical protein